VPQSVETAQGPVEYDFAARGRRSWSCTGAPGGWDQGRAMASAPPPQRLRAIMVSRPGYLGTELEARQGIDEQADLLAALLDALEVERAGVLCWSGGGPSSYSTSTPPCATAATARPAWTTTSSASGRWSRSS
jgi:pimeloyl-ACP methyl ester carboxylesterase